MRSKVIDTTTREINRHLHDLDRVMNRILYTMPYFDFTKRFSVLIEEISKRENLSRRNKNILGNYYSMCEYLDYSYEKWDNDNYETHPDYDEINAMYVDVHNSCNHKIFQFLKTYDAENIEANRFGEDETVSIHPFLDEIENARYADGLFGRIASSLNIRPGAFGLSIDVKKLFRK